MILNVRVATLLFCVCPALAGVAADLSANTLSESPAGSSNDVSVRFSVDPRAMGSAKAAQPLSLETIMQNPDWMGPPVEAAWWQLDGNGVVYKVKRSGTSVRDLYRATPDTTGPNGARIAQVTAAELILIDGPNPVLSTDGAKALSIVEGSLMLRALRGELQVELGERQSESPSEKQHESPRFSHTAGFLQRLYTGPEPVMRAMFSATKDSLVYFQAGSRWWQVDLADAAGPAAAPIFDPRFEDDPTEIGSDEFGDEQLRLFSTLERLRQQDGDQQQRELTREKTAPTLGAAPWFLGKRYQLETSRLSSDGRWLLLSVSLKADNEGGGMKDKMPKYVSRSGYVEVEDVRQLVGRNGFVSEEVWLLDLKTRTRYGLGFENLSGRTKDPLVALKIAQGLTPYGKDNLRPFRVSDVVWHPGKSMVLVQLVATDNKDRWTVRVDAERQKIEEIHRLTDNAWINWDNNELGWVPGTDTAWLLSEEDGYAHLYTIDRNNRQRQHTQGDFEFRAPAFSRNGKTAYGLSNRAHPTEWDLWGVSLTDNEFKPLTQLAGVESFSLHPNGNQALVRFSHSYTPTQAAVVDLSDGKITLSTDTRTSEYRALKWQTPKYVAVPSTHGVDRPIWSKFYAAAPEFKGPRPAVLFVHGAGYTQNTHHKFPYYFREQMFHNLLTSRGYHVLDMDYRASEGYGRDWRTSIYRQMGTPELEDYIDGVDWLVKEHNVDPARVGIYGGSYGGFMTFMALFKAPEVFAAGAALRPVTDWRHYNHGYTSAILNTPEVDPEAHRRSSPIEFAEGLQGHLLISHGMLDDNVFYKDSVRLAQRLIELEKQNWELASYPLEAHGYVHPESWLDQYRRILKLFESTIGSAAN